VGKTRLQVLFENIKLLSVTCFVRFLLPFEMWEYILPHPVYQLQNIWMSNRPITTGLRMAFMGMYMKAEYNIRKLSAFQRLW
jgi:hypothetical protein